MKTSLYLIAAVLAAGFAPSTLAQETAKAPTPDEIEALLAPTKSADDTSTTQPPTPAEEPAAPRDEPTEAAEPPVTSGDQLIVRAHKMTPDAKSVADYTALISTCQKAVRLGVSKESDKYARQLMAWAYNRRGEQLLDQGHDTVALADFEASIRNDPTRWRAFHNRGICYASMQQRDMAINDFNRTIELNPTYAHAYFNRGEVRYEMGQFDAAIKDYSRALQIMPSDAMSYNSRGHAFYRQGKYREAVRDFTVAIRLDPDSAEACTNRGDLYAELGYYEKAVHDYRAAVQIDPRLGRAYLSSAWLMATCPDDEWRSIEGAEQAIGKAARFGDRNNARYYETLAAVEANSGDFARAQRSLQHAIHIAPKEALPELDKRRALFANHRPFRATPKRIPASADIQQANHEQPGSRLE